MTDKDKKLESLFKEYKDVMQKILNDVQESNRIMFDMRTATRLEIEQWSFDIIRLDDRIKHNMKERTRIEQLFANALKK